MKPSKIKYQITSGYGIWQSYTAEGVVLDIVIDGLDCGYIQIGDVQSKICDGVATLDLSVIKDGVYEPIFVSEDKIIRLETIRKHRGTVEPTRTQDATVRRLLKRVKEVENIVSGLEQRVTDIEDKMRTDVIF